MKKARSILSCIVATVTLLGCGNDSGSMLDGYRSRLNSDARNPRFSPDGDQISFVRTVDGKLAIFLAGPRLNNEVRISFGIWDFAPYWSPDGRLLAFRRDIGIGEIGDVFVMTVDGHEETPLAVSAATESARGWLPDGSGVLYQRNNQTWVGPIDGGEHVPLLDISEGYRGVPSPDGSRVVYQRRDGGRQTLWLFDRESGEHRQLSEDGYEHLDGDSPWSPDGNLIAYHTVSTGTGDIWVVDANTGTARQITRHLANDDGEIWSPDGRWIAFVSDRGGQTDIWATRSDGSGTPIRVTDDARREVGLEWDPDGSRLIFQHGSSEFPVGLIGVGGADPRVVYTAHADLDFRLSPDGNTVLFTSRRSGNPDLWSVPAAGGDPVRLTRSPLPDGNAEWSPDGRTIAFNSRRSGNSDIYRMSPDGENVEQLTDWPGFESLARWSPDGSMIAFVSDHEATETDIWTIPAAGGEPTRVTNLDGRVGGVRWSPDGQVLSFIRFPYPTHPGRTLNRVPASGGPVTELYEGDVVEAEWSPDGRQLVMSIREEGHRRLYVMPAGGGTPRRLTNEEQEWDTGPEWSADGSEIIYNRLVLTGRGLNRIAAVNVADGTMRTLVGDSARNFGLLSFNGDLVLFGTFEADSPVDEVRIAELLADLGEN